MVSFNENGREHGSKRRRRATDTRRISPGVESLENRRLLATSIVTPIQTTVPVVGDATVKSGPLASAGQNLITVYQEYQQYAAGGGGGPFHSSLSGLIYFRGDKVGVDVTGTGDFGTFQTTLKNLGMDVTAVSTGGQKIVEGYLPISQLPTVVNLPQYAGISPIYAPTSYVRQTQYGSAANQGETALQALPSDLSAYPNIDGTGVKVGVLSTSVNQYDNPAVPGIGLAESYSTGDLDPANPVTVLKDYDNSTDSSGSTDEGRAMLEQIHDIAPGAKLYFYSGFNGDVDFANGIRALAQAGCKVIVDDIHYATEPFFQDGVIQQAINDVVKTFGVTYFAAAGNSADAGYASNFRGVTATVAGIGAGRYMNFNPGGGAAVTGLPVTVGAGGNSFTLQWDNPFTAGNNGVTSDLDVYFLDANNKIVAGANTNNIASGQPYEFFGVPAGNYTMVIQVAPGSPDVGRIQISEDSENGTTTFSHQFGSAGGTTYPNTAGHNAGGLTIGVGAVPWWNTPAYGVTTGLVNETFSSFGPVMTFFSPDGTRLSSPATLQKPDVSATDGNDTSFFGPGEFLSTLTPPFGDPASATELDGNTLPNFFGTSSAAPNLAAVAALMLQLSPGSTRNDILSAMKASALPLNGAAPGQYNVQGGFGLVQAKAAMNAVDLLRVVTATPASGATVTSLPPTIDLTFSRPIDFSTVQASDLIFTNMPAGVTVAVGKPILINPTTVRFPITVNSQVGTPANGAYGFKLVAGSIVSTDSRPLSAYAESFTVKDQSAPRVTNTVITGRQIIIKFSEPVRPDAVTGYYIKVLYLGTAGKPQSVYLNTQPGFQVRYDAANNSAIIDLSTVAQTALPAGSYEIIVSDLVTDLAGNKLDGEFQPFNNPAAIPGVFPSGNGTAGGNFFQTLANLPLTAPKVLSLSLDPTKGPAPYTTSDTGITGDQNTLVPNPFFIGSIAADFPSTYAGVTLAVQFNGLHNGTFDLNVGPGGRGFVGTPDLLVTTDKNGNFSFQTPKNLTDGLQQIRIVVVGQTDLPPLPGLSSSFSKSFRIDTTHPTLTIDPSSSVQQNSQVSTLSGGIVLKATDPVLPTALGSPFGVPTQFSFSALDPTTANNVSNYTLLNLGADGLAGGTGVDADTDYSSFIKSATFTSTNSRTRTSDPYTGTVALTFAAGLPAGRYALVAHKYSAGFVGIYDAAGNVLDADPNTPGNQSFSMQFNFQPTATYITSVLAVRADTVTGSDGKPTTTTSTYGPRSYFELPVPGVTARADAPPTAFIIDFSTALQPGVNYSNKVELIRSANSPTGTSDGDFGTDPSFTTGVGYSIVPGTTVTLVKSDPNINVLNRLVVKIAPGTTLAADHYRLFMPNVVTPAGVDQRIYDVYNNQLDGEFLGNPTSAGGYEDLLPNGQYRDGLSGDGVGGGSFETSYVVVPNGNIVYVRPDYQDEPLLSSDDPDGSLAKPYAALAPEGDPAKSSDLNSSANFLSGFNTNYDRNGNGKFDRSALVAAQQLSKGGTLPVVIVALPGITQQDQVTGEVTQATYVIQAPSGSDPISNDGSISIPANTDMVFNAGATVKLYNASIFVQNQGSSIDVRGTANSPVTFTSYLDDSVAGDTNNDGPSTGSGGDWGGIVLRNFNDTSRAIPVAPGPLYPSPPSLGVSGADDALSNLNYAKIRFGGGAVPQTIGYRFDSITLFNSRPAITNSIISDSAPAAGSTTPSGTGGAQAAISGDMDSFREDPLTRGPLIRRVQTFNNSINGIYVRAELNGAIEATDALTYTTTVPLTSSLPRQSYTFDDPLPFVIISRLELGTMLQVDSGQQTTATNDRLYISPGMLIKLQRGAGIDVNSGGFANGTVLNAAQLIIGDRTYISQYDVDHAVSPLAPVPVGTANSPYNDGKFHAPTSGDAKVVFTSFFDDNASTSFFDPVTGITTQIVAPIDSDNGGAVNLPTPGNVPALARWGGISVESGALADIDEAEFRYGGGSVNSAGGTIPQRDVLAFEGAGGATAFGRVLGQPLGTRAYITNNDFYDNASAPISDTPDGLLAADPLTPLISGNPFFRGNVMVRNDLNGMEILVPSGIKVTNLHVDSVWDDTDLIYILRNTIILAGQPLSANTSSTDYLPETRPYIALTIQAGLPDTLLANGQKIARPGESNIVKLLNSSAPIGDGVSGLPASIASSYQGGAGFLVGIDNGVDPPADSLIDLGSNSQIRITGIGGNETTGQQRVPVVLTSLRDSTASATRTIRGVTMGDATNPTQFGNTTAPAPGDGGMIGFGSLSLTDYNLFDPRDGNLIDNADIRYMTRIEIQGGGLIDNPGGNYDAVRAGTTPATQFNASKAMTISNTNIASFSQVGILETPGFDALQRSAAITGTGLGAYARISNVRGQPNDLFLVNSTIANSPVGMRINGEPSSTGSPLPNEAVLLNNTFYNNPVGVHIEAPFVSAGVNFVAMDNIFASSTTASVEIGAANLDASQLQYNLFYNSGAPSGAIPNYGPINGDPRFRDAANGDFSLLADSAAIDSARSELTIDPAVATLRAIADQSLTGTVGGIRNRNFRLAFAGSDPLNILSLPGYSVREPGRGASPAPYPTQSFYDEWVPQSISTTTGTAAGYAGPASIPGVTFNYAPISGERDSLGYLRIDDTARANIGTGSRPFFDIGAFEYRQLNPPHVVNDSTSASTGGGIAAVIPSGTGTQAIDIYKVQAGTNVGTGTSGLSVAPNSLEVAFDNLLDPTTINNQTILLQAAGGDGIFGNANSPQDKFIDLSGKLVYDAKTRKLTIKLADANLKLTSDLYKVTILGSGANVVRDKLGNALDGENIDGAGNQKDLPSGDGFPGGNFAFTFSIDTSPPVVSTNTVILAPSSDSGPRDLITNDNTPTFNGTATDVSPRGTDLTGDTVFLDYAGPDGKFGRLIAGTTPGTYVVDPNDPDGKDDVLNIGSALTAANGTFAVTVGQDAAKSGLVKTGYTMPDSSYIVGPDGILSIATARGKSIVRVRVVDQSGNQSNPNAMDALSGLIVDTTSPFVTGQNPIPLSQVSAVNGTVAVTIGVSENLDVSTLNASTIKVLRAGGDGVFGNANDVTLSIGAQITVTPFFINGVATPTGVQLVQFTITGATVNDLYRVILVGSGNNPIRDLAQNPLSTNFTDDFVVFNSSAVNHYFVGATATNPNGSMGSRANPYPTIQEAIDAAGVGDVVQVLPGVYNENVVLKSYVRVVSASTNSTDAVFFPGQALQTIIRPVPVTDPVAGTTTYNPVAVAGSNLSSLANIPTELSGFTLTNGLTGDPNRGTITPGSAGLVLNNSDILVDKNYFTDSEKGAIVNVSGANAPAAQFEDNGFIGNTVGLLVNDGGTASFRNGASLEVANNTVAFNTIGVFVVSNGPLTNFVDVSNNLFASNNTLTAPLGGAALISSTPDRAVLRSNMFYNNGSIASSSVDDVIGVGGSFDPHLLTTTPDVNGNFVGNAGFVNARDPRPIADGPANFFLDANFDLTLSSAAIDNAIASLAPKTDFLGRGRVDIANKGFTGRGPADIGAFEYNGTGGTTSSTRTTTTTTTTGSTGGGGFRPLSVSFDTAVPSSSAVTTAPAPAITASAADAVFSDKTSPTSPARRPHRPRRLRPPPRRPQLP